MNPNTPWTLYVLRNERGNLYTGITTDLVRRLRQHTGLIGGGAKFTRSCAHLEVVYSCEIGDRSMACQTEYRVKALSKDEKELLVREKPGREALLEKLKLWTPMSNSPH